MNLLVPPRRFDPDQPELMDRPGHSLDVLREDLRTLAAINRNLHAYAIPLDHLQQLLRHCRKGNAPLRILDLATGGADVPRAVADWARRERLPVAITAVDNNPDIVTIAREWSAGYPEICVERADALGGGFAPGRFDIVLNSLALHHFTEAQAIALLRRMAGIARIGFIVNDLRRSWVTLAIGHALAWTVFRNPLAKHDGPASCAAAFTPGELRAMAQQAGLVNYVIRRHPGARMVLRAWTES